MVNELSLKAFPWSSLYHQRASITQIHSWFAWAKGQPYCIQAAGCVQLVEEDEREGRGHKTMPQAGHSQREKTGVEAQCCHSCSDAALAICSAPLRRAASQDLILSNTRKLESFS